MVKRLEDIAKELKVSIATVSRALNKDTETLVKKETRDKILAYVKQTGFKPNIKARSLARGKLTNFFFILSQNEASIFYDQYFWQIIKGILSITIDTDYSLIIMPIENDYTEEQIYNLLLNSETAGLLLSPYCSYLEFPLDIVRGYNFPVIGLDNELSQAKNSYSILLDHVDAGYKGAEYLWKRGYRNIILISDVLHSQHSELRKKGFYQFFKRKKYGSYKIKEVEMRLSWTSGLPAVEDIMKESDYPLGVFALNDEIAASLISHLKDKGVRCPEEVGVLGFDGLSIGSYTVPRLSSVAFPFQDIGRIAAQIFIKALEGEKVSKKKEILASVREGQSC